MERDRVEPDFSVTVNINGEEVLVNAVYDHIHIFHWLGHSIMKIVTREGLTQFHTSESSGRMVAEMAGIIPIERTSIREREYEGYLKAMEAIMASELGDEWLAMEAEDGTEGDGQV